MFLWTLVAAPHAQPTSRTTSRFLHYSFPPAWFQMGVPHAFICLLTTPRPQPCVWVPPLALTSGFHLGLTFPPAAAPACPCPLWGVLPFPGPQASGAPFWPGRCGRRYKELGPAHRVGSGLFPSTEMPPPVCACLFPALLQTSVSSPVCSQSPSPRAPLAPRVLSGVLPNCPPPHAYCCHFRCG